MFDSRNITHKNPFGAVKTGTAVHFKITLPRDFHCSQARLVIQLAGDAQIISEMFWCGMNGDSKEWWECHFTPETSGIYFYNFECKTDHGTRSLMRNGEGKAVLQGFDRWQMTVYDDFETPNWLSGGTIYQIFPDRFYKSGNLPENIPHGRIIHENWSENAVWWPADDGEIHNNDFFGGNLKGIEEKLPYLKSLGVTCIYLNPIFEAHSNHRYDTADYSKIDPLLGNEKDFSQLCLAAKKLEMHIVLDGVFSHTGSDSIYFNRQNRYDSIGAYQSQNSPYSSWYNFKNHPNEYDCWWGFITLPNVNEKDHAYNEYINGENGIARKWLKLGADGWRLDVADELPDEFLDNFTAAVKEENDNALVMGEVWEDATNKMAYGYLRRYLLGNQLDSVMNYPFREAILAYILGGDSQRFFEIIYTIIENYPPQCLHVLMNHIGTHDTERILSLLGGINANGLNREQQSKKALSPDQFDIAVKRLKIASLIQYTLPGVPSLYYGDETGMQGLKDPFNRETFPWGNENQELVSWYKTLGELRQNHKVFQKGNFEKIYSQGNVIAYKRFDNQQQHSILIICNTGNQAEFNSEIIPKNSVLTLGEDTLGGKIFSLSFSVYVFEEVKNNYNRID